MSSHPPHGQTKIENQMHGPLPTQPAWTNYWLRLKWNDCQDVAEEKSYLNVPHIYSISVYRIVPDRFWEFPPKDPGSPWSAATCLRVSDDSFRDLREEIYTIPISQSEVISTSMPDSSELVSARNTSVVSRDWDFEGNRLVISEASFVGGFTISTPSGSKKEPFLEVFKHDQTEAVLCLACFQYTVYKYVLSQDPTLVHMPSGFLYLRMHFAATRVSSYFSNWVL